MIEQSSASLHRESLLILVVAITDSTVSPAAAVADHTLIVHTASVGPRLGLAGAMVLIEAVVATVALQDSARSRAAGEVANSLFLDDIVGSADPPPTVGQAARYRTEV